MIRIKSMDASHQYDREGRAITTWDGKKCSWIINQEFEDEEIDWWGKDNDFPSAYKLSNYIEQHPDWDKKPTIIVTWTWNTPQDMQITCGRPSSISECEWYIKTKFPFSDSRDWGYLDYNEEEAIEHLGKYCDFHKHANTKVVYNGKEIFNGILK